MKKAMIILLVMIAAVFNSPAYALDISTNNYEIINKDFCAIAAVSTNDYNTNKPLVVFFPGSQETGSIRKTMTFVKKYKLYNKLDINLIAVAFQNGSEYYKDWEPAAEELADFLAEITKDKNIPILLDAVSLGGYGAYVTARLLEAKGVDVSEVNLADACLPHLITGLQIQEMLDNGIHVNVYGCGATSRTSKNTRSIIKEFADVNDFNGDVLASSHGGVLSVAIHNSGLHSEYEESEFEVKDDDFVEEPLSSYDYWEDDLEPAN